MPTAVVYGGPSAEHEISVLTGLQCERALADAGVSVVPLYWSPSGEWYQAPSLSEARDFLDGPPDGATPLRLTVGGKDAGWWRQGRLRPQRLEVDAILNCCHGGPGESGALQWVAQLNDVPCTGGSPAMAMLGMDKLAFGAVVRELGLPTLPRVLVTDGGAAPDFEGPYLLKPRYGGSSIGIHKVADWASAQDLARVGKHYRDGAVAEPYRPDLFDLNVAFRTWPTMRLSLIEKPLRGGGGDIYGYEEKYLQGAGLEASPRELPAQLSPALQEALESAVHRLSAGADIFGVVRVDFLSDGESWFVNEVNTIPGAMALYLWDGKEGLADTLLALLDEARHRHRPLSVQLTGDALRTAGGISAKLSSYRAGR